MLAAQTVKDRHSDEYTFLHGNLGLSASPCHIPSEALTGSLVYVSAACQLLPDQLLEKVHDQD